MLLNIATEIHKRSERDYLGRMIDNKVVCSEIARRFDKEFFDGARRTGYGGYHYDGRWEGVAKKLVEHYQLKDDARILDVGCGKGFLLREFQKLLPDAQLDGFDVSEYAIKNSHEDVRDLVYVHNASDPFYGEYDLAVSFMTLHNLVLPDLCGALRNMQDIAKDKFITVESYRNPEELFNLQCWALTCESFFRPEEWEYIFELSGYTGDWEFLYFE